MNAPHLDDEQLSLLLDGEDDSSGDRAHLTGCDACRARLSSLDAARNAVASAIVPALPESVVDVLVATALGGETASESPDRDAHVVTLPVRRRLMVPPPAWLIGAAAALAALVGIAGLLRAADESGSRATVALRADDRDEGDGESGSDDFSSGAADSGTAAESAAPPAAFGPDVVAYDLADQEDAAVLVGLLRERPSIVGAESFSTTQAAAGATAAASSDAGGEGSTSGASAGRESAPVTTMALDRAQCRAEAERLAAGRFTALESTATLRWRGQPAEVLVFQLAAPGADGLTRQAMVLARPGCALLADPRF